MQLTLHNMSTELRHIGNNTIMHSDRNDNTNNKSNNQPEKKIKTTLTMTTNIKKEWCHTEYKTMKHTDRNDDADNQAINENTQ